MNCSVLFSSDAHPIILSMVRFTRECQADDDGDKDDLYVHRTHTYEHIAPLFKPTSCESLLKLCANTSEACSVGFV